MTRPLLDLVLILKNEEKVVEKTLDSCLGVIDGLTVVIDEATSDGTQGVILEWTKRHGIPLCMSRSHFENYAAQRNKALDIDATRADPPVFTLSMSADETLQGGDKLRAFLELRRDDADGAYLITMQTDSRRWPYSRVLRTNGRWRYEGIIHEQPVSPDGVSKPDKLIPGVTVLHAESDPKRKLERMLNYDLPLLTKFVDDESKTLVERARGIFFLAETHLFIGHNCPRGADGDQTPGGAWFSHYMQAMALYWRHAEISEHAGQTALDLDSAHRARFMFYYVASKLDLLTPEELERRLTEFCAKAPHIAEARMLLAECGAQIDARRGRFLALEAFRVFHENEKKSDQIRFSSTDVEVKWRSLALATRCAAALGDMKGAEALAKRAIAAGCPPALFKFEEKRA